MAGRCTLVSALRQSSQSFMKVAVSISFAGCDSEEERQQPGRHIAYFLLTRIHAHLYDYMHMHVHMCVKMYINIYIYIYVSFGQQFLGFLHTS